jgi:hypothetical protein
MNAKMGITTIKETKYGRRRKTQRKENRGIKYKCKGAVRELL